MVAYIRILLKSLLVATLGVLCSWGPLGHAAVEIYDMKAAFLYNFAKFVEWPDKALPPDQEPFTICVQGEERMQQAADRILQDKQVQGRPVSVRLVRAQEDAPLCQVLFVDATVGAQAERVGGLSKTFPVLTVGESDRFLQWGGIIKLFVEDGRLRFEISPQAAARAQLRVSSKLLKLGRIVESPNGD